MCVYVGVDVARVCGSSKGVWEWQGCVVVGGCTCVHGYMHVYLTVCTCVFMCMCEYN